MDDLDIAIKASKESKGILHPLRKIVDGRKMPTNPDKELLTLSVGNTIYGDYNYSSNTIITILKY